MHELILKERVGVPQEYRLIAVSVTAIQLTPESFEKARTWCGGVPVTEIDAFDSKKRFVALNIPTIRGVVRAGENDWIVKDPYGMISVLDDRDFRERYEKV